MDIGPASGTRNSAKLKAFLLRTGGCAAFANASRCCAPSTNVPPSSLMPILPKAHGSRDHFKCGV